MPMGLGIAPVAVVPEHQGRGIGSKLIRQALSVCRANVVALVVVLGDPDYYSRFGFVPASMYGLKDVYGGGHAFQAIWLAAYPLMRRNGAIRPRIRVIRFRSPTRSRTRHYLAICPWVIRKMQ